MLALLAPLAGIGTGLVGTLFRMALGAAGNAREWLAGSLESWSGGGFLLFVASAAIAASLSAWLVRHVAPTAAGSGIPRVIAVLEERQQPAPWRVVPVKFVAGTLAIGPGLALGREGPSVQMGASIAYQIGRIFGRSGSDGRALLAAGAGAGFAVAFNAPIAGALFVLETLVKRFEARMAIAALAASAAAILVGRAILGNTPDYTLAPLKEPGFAAVPFYIVLGVAAGLAGIVYNRSLLAVTAAAGRLSLPVEARAALVGASVAVVAWFWPALVGSGDVLAAEALRGTGSLVGLPLLFAVRLLLILCSVSAGTPGGLLVPFLSLGAELGLWIGLACSHVLPQMGFQPQGFAVVGMAALFTAIVRAPLTAIVLVTEMTADVTMLLPMVVACSVALFMPVLFGDLSILESLKERMPGGKAATDPALAASS